MRPIRAVFLPPATDPLGQPGQILLKDGTAAELRIARQSDTGGLRQFIDRLSPESKRHRFFSETAPPDEVVASLCDSSDPRSQLTLIAVRISHGRPAVVAVGTYTARDAGTAEVSLAVDDTLHGKGIGTILVEHLALLAVRHGFTQLWAVTHAENLAMREVFRESRLSMARVSRGRRNRSRLIAHAHGTDDHAERMAGSRRDGRLASAVFPSTSRRRDWRIG